MEPEKPQSKERRLRIGQEAVDGYEGDTSLVSKVIDTPETSASKNSKKTYPKPDHGHHDEETINRPLIECYPEMADDKDETLLADVRRFWLGRFGIIFTGGFLIAAMIGFSASTPTLLRGIGYETNTASNGLVGSIALIVSVLIGLGTLLTLWVYNHNRMLITDENIIEIRQMNLFSRKVSHLNMINVEDVTVIRHGVLQTIFNYGNLSIETAGEKDNFSFSYTPSPDVYRRLIISAHEKAIDRVGNMGPGQRVQITENGL